MADKAELIDSFVDTVMGEAPQDEVVPDEPIEELTDEEVIESGGEIDEEQEELEGQEPVVEGDDKAELVEFQLGDQVYEVPPALKEQLDMASDYTQKTQALSADRKTLDALKSQNQILKDQFDFYQSVQEEVGQLQQINSTIEQWRQYKRENIDSLTPAEFIKVDTAIEELQIQGQAVQEALGTKNSEFQQAQEQSRKELLEASTEALRSRIPNWSDDEWEKTKTFGQSLGFTDDELSQAVDPRYREVLWMASQYKALKEKTAPTAAKLKAAPQIQPKSRKTMPKETQDKLNLRKQLHSKKLTARDKRRLVEDDIGKRFG